MLLCYGVAQRVLLTALMPSSEHVTLVLACGSTSYAKCTGVLHSQQQLLHTSHPFTPVTVHAAHDRYGANNVVFGQDQVNQRRENTGFANLLVSHQASATKPFAVQYAPFSN